MSDENAVKKACIDLLAYLGWLVLRVNSGSRSSEYTNKEGETKKRFHRYVTWLTLGKDPQPAGVSDILAIEPGTGRLWAIETKAPGKRDNVSQAQAAFLAAVRERGGVAIVVDDVDQLREEIERRLA